MKNDKQDETNTGINAENTSAENVGANAADVTSEGEETADLEQIEEWLADVDERIVRAVKDMGFTKFSPIQEMAIPRLLEGVDIIGQAQTGTGKTAAFGIPVLQKVNPEVKKLQSIILCPTRELAMQAAEELRKIAKYMHGIKVLPIYGGQDISRQIIGLKGVQIIVGTPGRVMDHMRRHTIKLDDVSMVVLDEADEMLNMGFREDMETILGQIPGEHQTALFSATMPQPILDITNQFQKDAELLKVAAKELTIPLVSQRYYRVKNIDKDAATQRLLEYYQPSLCLIFCNTKSKVDELSEVLKKAGFRAEGLHGDMSQHQRDLAMNRFRNGSTHILIATDVAARGIDVDNVEAVINYDIPQDIEYYVHRIGRTGRAGKTGRSFTFVTNREMYRIREIERMCSTEIKEKKLPGASKALKAKADKYLNRAWELHEHEDIALMKEFLERKMEEEDCSALELAAVMLKLQVGDKGPEIEADKPAPRDRGFGRFGRRDDFRRDGEFRRDGARPRRFDDRRPEGDRGGRRFGRPEGERPEGEGYRSRRRFEGERPEGEGYRSRRRFEGERPEGEGARNRRRPEGERPVGRRKAESAPRDPRQVKAKDIRIDGSERGIAFSRPKKRHGKFDA